VRPSHKGFIVDKDDSSVTRSHDYFLTLFARAKLSVLKVKLQRNFPSELFAVRMYALKPEA
jgi:protein N-terminal methyltransferase